MESLALAYVSGYTQYPRLFYYVKNDNYSIKMRTGSIGGDIVDFHVLKF